MFGGGGEQSVHLLGRAQPVEEAGQLPTALFVRREVGQQVGGQAQDDRLVLLRGVVRALQDEGVVDEPAPESVRADGMPLSSTRQCSWPSSATASRQGRSVAIQSLYASHHRVPGAELMKP
ncbi:hypothetical protein SAV14893_082400 [Streptomyces avermitilis]|uniref:Uncharacterized protein n=1 Tax=Streptomyces avermitilis TaxID=33903 RepID=A0A4D4MBQ2_STRAX|nr:hypothetical protein [Streptomyces avermitilis]GDY68847.1 hypothetical protein SAV14893_082400 [Streptomyces avermitilis]